MVGQVKKHSQTDTQNKYWYRQRVVNELGELLQFLETNHKNLAEQPDFDELIYDSEEIEEDTWHPLFLPCHIEEHGTELFSAAIKFFGGWQGALNCSGLGGRFDSEFGRLQKNYWDQDKIIEHIRILFDSHFDLSIQFIKQVYPELFYTAIKKDHFGSWKSALYEAEVGDKYLKANAYKFWTIRSILQTIIDLEDTFGNIQPNMVRNFNPSLYLSSRRYFKYWPEVVNKAGLNLKKNSVKVYLEPFREYLVGEYLKLIYDKLGVEYKVEPFNIEAKCDIENIEDNESQDALSIPLIDELPKNCLILDEGRTGIHGAYVIPKFRSWWFGIENLIEKIIGKHPIITFYHSTGEPREWLDERIRFENLNKYYPELLDKGEDIFVSDLCLIARGGIPKDYQELFDKIMKDILDRIKK